MCFDSVQTTILETQNAEIIRDSIVNVVTYRTLQEAGLHELQHAQQEYGAYDS